MEFYIIPYSNNLKAHVSDLMAKGKTPLTMEDIITHKKTKISLLLLQGPAQGAAGNDPLSKVGGMQNQTSV